MKLRRLRRWFTQRPTPWVSTGSTLQKTPVLTGPPLAIVVICHKMNQQIAKTLLSLIPPYQQGVKGDEYEIHLVDNGSPEPLAETIWTQSSNIQYHYISPQEASVNPGTALNRAVARTSSPLLCLMIDGARIATPGVLRWGMDLASISPSAIVDVRSWHLGHKSQNDSLVEGYSPQVEQSLLDSIHWPADGYRLFEIGFPSNPTRSPFLGCVFESNCLFISRNLFNKTGGYDERYRAPGGGLTGVDFFHRAVLNADRIFTLLGEGTFHQTHGGAASGLDRKTLEDRLEIWREEYESLSRPWRDRHRYDTVPAGHVPPPALRWLIKQSRK